MRFKQRLELQELTTDQNEYGEPVNTWKTIDALWGKVEPLGGDELNNSQVSHKADYKVTCHYDCRIKEKLRFRFDDMILNIADVMRLDMEKRYLEVQCKSKD